MMTIYVCELCGMLLSPGEAHPRRACKPSDWKYRGPILTHEERVAEIVRLAHADDAEVGDGAHFDREGWSTFTLEDWKVDPDAVQEAWSIYENEVWGR